MRWEEPPDIHRASKYSLEVEALKRRKEEWAVIEEFNITALQDSNYKKASSLQQYIRDGKGDFRPEGAFESTIRTVENVVKVYVRYVGEK